MTTRWPILLLVCSLAAMGLSCPRSGSGLITVGGTTAQVVGVLPYELADDPGQIPESARLCYSDGDCVVVTVRHCCPACGAEYLAVNQSAMRAIGRYHESHPCDSDEACPDLDCGRHVATSPLAGCQGNRCTLKSP